VTVKGDLPIEFDPALVLDAEDLKNNGILI